MNSALYLPERFPPDLSFTDEQIEQISRLTPADVANIDNWLLSFAIYRWRKVAFLVMSAMSELKPLNLGLPDVFYILRVQMLIEEGRLELDGNMNFWRNSEVRLPKTGIEWK